jgi:rhamnose transport system permease protein
MSDPTVTAAKPAVAAAPARRLSISVLRYNPSDRASQPRLQTYELEEADGMTLFIALNEIKEKQDPSLQFDFVCRAGICGSCAMLVNGRPTLACRTLTKNLEPGLTLADVAWLRDNIPAKLIVKGVQHPDDARALADAGVDAIVLSNHGGRQLDRAVVPLELPSPLPLPVSVVVVVAVSAPLVGVTTLLTGAAMGSVNGYLVAALRLPSIVVTLAMMVILREALRWAREGEFVRDLPGGFQWFGLGGATGPWAIVGVALVVFVVFACGLRHVAAGRAVYATGSDEEAARLAGLRPERVTFGVFVLMGTLSGLAGLLNAVRFSSVDPNAGAGEELRAIAAVVVGGVAINGGRGTLVGAALGVLLLGTVGSALVFLGLPAPWEKAAQGAIILVAVASDAWNRSGRHS